jgi:hypothetical protein
VDGGAWQQSFPMLSKILRVNAIHMVEWTQIRPIEVVGQIYVHHLRLEKMAL